MPQRRALEKLRRIYGELVRGRTRLEIVTAAIDPADTPPRFLLGPYRSGTTLVRYCLDSHPNLAVPPETDFMAPLLDVLDDPQSVSGFSGLGIGTDDVERRLAHFMRAFHDTYAAARHAKSGWLDKSPHYAENPEQIASAFPDASFVVLHRHPLDQIDSFTRGGTFAHRALGQIDTGAPLIEAAAQYWVRVVAGLRNFASHHSEATLTVRYEDLCESPRETLERILEHLSLPWSDNVLNYHQHDHDLGREGGRVAGTVGFDISTGRYNTWPTDWLETAWSLTRDTATALGYDSPFSDRP